MRTLSGLKYGEAQCTPYYERCDILGAIIVAKEGG